MMTTGQFQVCDKKKKKKKKKKGVMTNFNYGIVKHIVAKINKKWIKDIIPEIILYRLSIID